MADVLPVPKFAPGDRILIGDGAIPAVIEEVILMRGMIAALYLVEWWQDGNVHVRRFHEEEIA